MREFQSEKSEMFSHALNELDFCSRVMREIIAPPGTAGSKGERLRNAARQLRWTESRTRDVWYGDSRVSIKPASTYRLLMSEKFCAADNCVSMC